MKRNTWLPLLLACALGAGIWLGWALSRNDQDGMHGESKLHKVFSLIQDNYVDEVDIDSLVEMTIPLLLENLDPHSAYIPAKDLESVTSELEGKFSGIGISFQILNDTLSVIEVINGGPAEKVGMLPGDRILEVDGKNIAGTSITNDDVFNMLRGVKGTTVDLTVKRNSSSKPVKFTITRDDIPVESVDAVYMLNDSTGYVKVSRFARNTYEEFMQALFKLRLDGATSFVIDLRYNSGGYMEPAVLMVNEFLDAGNIIVSTRGRDARDDNYILSDGRGSFSNENVAVLINEFTASSSEIFSGAIQDNDRGWIIGRRSFGKGLVQQPIMMPDSSEVRLTVQRYYTPSGRSIQKEYKPGANYDYEADLLNRFNNGEALNADSIKLHTDLAYTTVGGRTVYGGGGIMPDLFVPEDTAGRSSYYSNVVNQNLIATFAYEYCDLNRNDLEKAEDVDELFNLLPSNDLLLWSFVQYAANKGVPARWYYINKSSKLIVNNIKAAIARNILGFSAYYQVLNDNDPAVMQAVKQLSQPLIADDESTDDK